MLEKEVENVFSGVTASRSIRKIILIEKAGLEDAASALDSGVDDFLVKSISSRELLARVGTVFRSSVIDLEEKGAVIYWD